MLQIFGMLKQGSITFVLGLSNIVSQGTVCKCSKKADYYDHWTDGHLLKIKNIV